MKRTASVYIRFAAVLTVAVPPRDHLRRRPLGLTTSAARGDAVTELWLLLLLPMRNARASAQLGRLP